MNINAKKQFDPTHPCRSNSPRVTVLGHFRMQTSRKKGECSFAILREVGIKLLRTFLINA